MMSVNLADDEDWAGAADCAPLNTTNSLALANETIPNPLSDATQEPTAVVRRATALVLWELIGRLQTRSIERLRGPVAVPQPNLSWAFMQHLNCLSALP
jgi:hypothetical protein